MNNFTEQTFYTSPYQLVAMPFLLDDGREATLYLPARALTRREADRLKRYVDSLVVDDRGAQNDERPT